MRCWNDPVGQQGPEVERRPQQRTSLMENTITQALGIVHGVVSRLLLSPQVHLCLHRPIPPPLPSAPPPRAGSPLP